MVDLNLNLQWLNAARSLNYGLVLMDLNGYILDYNEFWVQLALQNNVPPDFEWRGVNLIQIAESRRDSGDRLARYCLSKLDDLLQGIDSFDPVQFHNHMAAGSQWLMLEAAPLLDHDQNVRGLVLSVHDISALHTATTSAESSSNLESSPISRLLPMCAVCKRIRDNQEHWHSLESYLKNHLHIEFTHDICTECMGHLYPQYAAILEKKRRNP